MPTSSSPGTTSSAGSRTTSVGSATTTALTTGSITTGSTVVGSPACVGVSGGGAVTRSSSVRSIGAEGLVSLLEGGLDRVLLIDSRPFVDYNASHILEAVNVNCSKLMKRRLQQDKVQIHELLQHSAKKKLELQGEQEVVVYDQSSSDPASLSSDAFLSVLLAKLDKSFPSVHLLSGGFLEFSHLFPGLCEGKSALVPSCISQPCLPVMNVGPTRILPHLYLGCQRDVLNKELMQQNDIAYVLNASNTCPKPDFIPDSHFLRVPVNDSFCEKILPWLDKSVEFIEKAKACNARVLVHCLAGISRSATIAIAYIMKRMDMSLDEAYRFVKEKRPTISPNFNFLGQLLDFERKIKSPLMDFSLASKPPISSSSCFSSSFSSSTATTTTTTTSSFPSISTASSASLCSEEFSAPGPKAGCEGRAPTEEAAIGASGAVAASSPEGACVDTELQEQEKEKEVVVQQQQETHGALLTLPPCSLVVVEGEKAGGAGEEVVMAGGGQQEQLLAQALCSLQLAAGVGVDGVEESTRLKRSFSLDIKSYGDTGPTSVASGCGATGSGGVAGTVGGVCSGGHHRGMVATHGGVGGGTGDVPECSGSSYYKSSGFKEAASKPCQFSPVEEVSEQSTPEQSPDKEQADGPTAATTGASTTSMISTTVTTISSTIITSSSSSSSSTSSNSSSSSSKVVSKQPKAPSSSSSSSLSSSASQQPLQRSGSMEANPSANASATASFLFGLSRSQQHLAKATSSSTGASASSTATASGGHHHGHHSSSHHHGHHGHHHHQHHHHGAALKGWHSDILLGNMAHVSSSSLAAGGWYLSHESAARFYSTSAIFSAAAYGCGGGGGAGPGGGSGLGMGPSLESVRRRGRQRSGDRGDSRRSWHEESTFEKQLKRRSCQMEFGDGMSESRSREELVKVGSQSSFSGSMEIIEVS
ncbi:dual specificity protein phosphatase 16 [Engraulis encrasicolus]|uniref:dual specificity protein phosphatase 16 n=1 Tax=Engraulis encrasicolus TaxID=184585 RepID=UPI002FD54B56